MAGVDLAGSTPPVSRWLDAANLVAVVLASLTICTSLILLLAFSRAAPSSIAGCWMVEVGGLFPLGDETLTICLGDRPVDVG